MSRAERIKEEIGWLKLVFAVTAAIDVSLVAWLAQNYSTADPILLLTCFAATVAATVVLVIIGRRVGRLLDQLESE